MAVNAATSTYVNNASSSKGFSGLASGVDTESMVEQLLSGTQSKIDKQEGVKQQIQWKQAIYQDIIAKINAFQSKFFSYTSSTNLASSSFWNALSVFANSSAFKATAGANAAVGNTSISVRRLATKTTVTSGSAVSGDLTGKLDVKAFREIAKSHLDGDYSVQFQVGSSTVDVDLKDVFLTSNGDGFRSYTTPELDSALQKKLQDAFNEATSGVTVTVTDGEVSIVGTGISKNISVTGGGDLGLQRLGVSVGDSGKLNSEKTNGTLTSTVDPKPTMQFYVALDDIAKQVSVDLTNVVKNNSIDTDALRDALQAGIEKVHGSGTIKVEFGEDNTFSLKVYTSTGREDVGRKLDIAGTQDVMDVLGMKNGQSNRVSLSYTLEQLNLATPLRGDSYRFTINDVEFHFTSDTTIIDAMDIINRSNAGVRMYYRAEDDKFILETKETGAGKAITMDQSEGNFLNAIFGGNFKVGTVKAKNLEDFEPADTKGKTFKLPDDKKADEVTLRELGIDKLGDLDVDTVKLSELSSGGKYYYGTDSNGNITILQKLDANTKLSDMGYSLIGEDGTDYSNYALAALERATGGKIVYKGGELILNGYWARSADAATTKALDELFGKGVALGYEDGDTVTSRTIADIVKATSTSPLTPGDEATTTLGMLGITLDGVLSTTTLAELATIEGGKYYYQVDDEGNVTILQKVDENTKLSDLGFTFTGYNFDPDATLADLEEVTEGKLVFKNGKITLTGYYAEEADAATTETLNKIFGEGVALGKTGDSGLEIVMGQNAEIQVGDVITERSSNNFDINGINFDVTDITGSYEDPGLTKQWDENGEYYVDADGNRVDPLSDESLVFVDGEWKRFVGNPVTVTVKQDTDTIIDGIKSFIDDYNVLIKELNDLLEEDTNYRDYAPLTSAQKAEMSEREIELWEEKAKEGLLHNDTTIQAFLQQMRTALYQKPDGCQYALYQLGIETGEWEAKGQLTFVVGGEATLRNLLENDPTGVASLFTGINGLGTTLNEILKNTASTSSGSPGTLVQIAGTKGNDTNSSIYDQLKAIDEKIERLKLQYEAEKTRYWKQFNTMEQLISNMNTQSAYLAQMMGMSY